MTASRPIWEDSSVQAKVAAVKRYVRRLCYSRNLFAWRDFIDDLNADMELWIYKLEEEHRQGKGKETGVGAYNRMALQGALNYAAFYSAQKRKINYEAASLDAVIETEKGSMISQIPAVNDYALETSELLISIEQEFGDTIRELVQKVFDGEQLSRADLQQLKSTEGLQNYLKDSLITQ